jgi:hypothetical protein
MHVERREQSGTGVSHVVHGDAAHTRFGAACLETTVQVPRLEWRPGPGREHRLRFVRNWISRAAGPGELIETGADIRRIIGWTWKPVPEPALTWLPARAQAWEQARYRAYQARLAGHTIGETFAEAGTFLTLTGADAASSTDTGQHRIRNQPILPG